MSFLTEISGIGVGQSVMDVTSSRAMNVVYKNETGRTIVAIITMWQRDNEGSNFTLDGVQLPMTNSAGTVGSQGLPVVIVVPAGSTYSAESGYFVGKWIEIR